MADLVSLGFGGAYAVSLVVLLVWLQAIPRELRPYCYPLVAITGVAAVAQVFTGFAIGTIPVGGSSLDLANTVEGGFVYAALFGAAAVLGGATRRQLVLAVGLPFLMNWAFQGAALASGPVMAVSALIVVGGWVALCWLFFRPIWASAQKLPEDRRRLFWKFRNLLLFLIGVLIFSAFTTLGLFTATVASIITGYVDFLLRVGFSAFLFANVEVFRGLDAGEMTGREEGASAAAD